MGKTRASQLNRFERNLIANFSGLVGLRGQNWGNAPTVDLNRVGSGITIVSKETKKYLEKLEKRLKSQTEIGLNRS